MTIALASVLILLTSSKYSNANELYIEQAGDNLNLTVVQKGEDNQIKGTGSNTSAQLSGNDNSLDINQGYAGGNLLQLNVDGANNNIVVGQEKAYSNGTWTNDTNSLGNHTATVDVTGDYNDVQIIQRNNNSSSAGHTSGAVITNGDGNSIQTLQTGDGGTNGHNSYVHVKDGRDGNTVDVFQNSDTADHKATVSIYSNNNDIDIDQTGTSTNRAYVLFSHNNTGPVDFSLSQSGGDTYGNPDTGSYATISCGNVNGCSVSVSQ